MFGYARVENVGYAQVSAENSGAAHTQNVNDIV